MNTLPNSGYFCFFTKLELESFIGPQKNDWMILESNPEPGYYSKANFPLNKRFQHDHHLYIVIKKSVPCFQDIVLRKGREIIQRLDLSIHASPGQLTLFNTSYQCIRLRASELEHIYPLISGLKSEGIDFLKAKKVPLYSSFVQYKKYIILESLYDGVYLDVKTPNRYLVQTPRPVDYNEFERLVTEIKQSCKYNYFDASLAYLNQGEDTFDFIAVYSDHCEKERLKEFKTHIDKLVR